MQIVRISASDCRLLAARYAEHDNSHRRMRDALHEAGAEEAAVQLTMLRRLERSFSIDFGSLCHRFMRRDDAHTHPLERAVLQYVARWGEQLQAGAEEGELLVLVDRVRELRDLIEENGLVGEPER